MPRRTKDDAVTDTTTEATVETASPDATEAAATSVATGAGAGVDAGGSDTAANGETKPKRNTVDDLPLGNTKTRTGAEATVIQGPQGKRVFTAGGDKGAKIAELLRTRTDLPRKEIAAMVGCSQSRVAEVARVLGLAAPRPKPDPAAEPAASADAGEPAASTPAADAPAEQPTSQPTTVST